MRERLAVDAVAALTEATMGANGSTYSEAAIKQDIEECKQLLTRDSLRALWKQIDFNGNGYVSLAEIDKMVVNMAETQTGPFKDFDNKPALHVPLLISHCPPPPAPSACCC